MGHAEPHAAFVAPHPGADAPAGAGLHDLHAADDRLVAETCATYGAHTRRRLRQLLDEAAMEAATAGAVDAAYLHRLVADYPTRGGKMLRPSLCIASARAFGASIDDAVDMAASIELLHNALLVHDDIQDGSERRRGRPTLHALHGLPLALNAGDALGLLSLRPLRDQVARFGPTLAARLFAETERMAWETTEGQALELGWRRDNRVDLDDEHYLTMVLKKTCWLTTIHPLRAGCLIGTRGRAPGGGPLEPLLDALLRVGFFCGAAFQIQDDLLNLVEPGEAAAAQPAADGPPAPGYGKEADGDLLEGKRTLMLLHALRAATPPERARLVAYLAAPRERRDREALVWVRAQLTASGGVAHARQVAQALAGAALCEFDHHLAPALRDGDDRRFLRALITWVLRRGH